MICSHRHKITNTSTHGPTMHAWLLTQYWSNDILPPIVLLLLLLLQAMSEHLFDRHLCGCCSSYRNWMKPCTIWTWHTTTAATAPYCHCFCLCDCHCYSDNTDSDHDDNNDRDLLNSGKMTHHHRRCCYHYAKCMKPFTRTQCGPVTRDEYGPIKYDHNDMMTLLLLMMLLLQQSWNVI